MKRTTNLLALLLLLALHTTICPHANGQSTTTTSPVIAISSNPPSNNTPLVQPAALSTGEDKSYLSYYAAGIAQLIANPVGLTGVVTNKLYLPRTLFSYGARFKSGSGSTTVTPEVIYIDVLGGVEWGVQDVTLFNAGRTVTGPGLSLRIDLSPSRFKWVSAYNLYRQEIQADTNGMVLSTISEEQLKKLRSSFIEENGFLEKFALAGRSLRVSTFLTHQWLDSTRFATGGFTVSQVVSLTHDLTVDRRVWGVVPRFALQAISSDISGDQASKFNLPRYSSSVRTSLGLAFQNEVPRVKDCLVTRWNLQFGGEYVFKNATDGGESYGIYTRFRDLKAHTETFFSIGRAPSHDFQFGVGMTFTHE